MFNLILSRLNKIAKVLTQDAQNNSLSLVLKLDVALMAVGFKLSHSVIDYFAKCSEDEVKKLSSMILDGMKEVIGDHVKHNTYFKDFPKNVPDTTEFWSSLLEELNDEDMCTFYNLLDFPKYGSYQHSYEEMLSKKENLVVDFLKKSNLHVLQLGESLDVEVSKLYKQLACSTIPLSASDREILEQLALTQLDQPVPSPIKIRENKAIINKIRLLNKKEIEVDTTTDVLRLACALAPNGDLTLRSPTKFKSFKRFQRRVMMQALQNLLIAAPQKMEDALKYKEQWKRLSEFLHPHEFKTLPQAQYLFAVVRGEKEFISFSGFVERSIQSQNINQAIDLLMTKPGVLLRNLDRLLRLIKSDEEFSHLQETLVMVLPKVSGRVILSLIEHLSNRIKNEFSNKDSKTLRIFGNSKGTAWITENTVAPIKVEHLTEVTKVLQREIHNRMNLALLRVAIEPGMSQVALPLSEKNKPNGAFILPRGSISKVNPTEFLRFFIHWKQKELRTDYDLSCLILDEQFKHSQHCSYTQLRSGGMMIHSGDVVTAPEGASEFIDVKLSEVKGKYIIPQVNHFSGETYNDCAEAFFGYMERTEAEKGKPFEARTVRMKSDIRGEGKVYLPLVFIKQEDGWYVKWLHMFLTGTAWGNRVERNYKDSSYLVKAVIERNYLKLQDLLDLEASERTRPPTSDIFIGMQQPSGDRIYNKVYTLDNLAELIPA